MPITNIIFQKWRRIKFGATLAGIYSLAVCPVYSDSFGSGGNAFTIDFVNVGNPGNADDVNNLYNLPGDQGAPYGGVSYPYRMGVYEITQDAITKATAGGLTGVTGGVWTASQPGTNLTWYEAAAFVNWLNTNTGHQPAYQLDAAATTLTLWSSLQAWQVDGENLYRNKDAYYFLPSEDEWYKSAFHKNDGVTAGYWDYATGSNSIPAAVASGAISGTVVYNSATVAPAPTNSAGGLSPYGTMGQDGNVSEWRETAFDGVNNAASEDRLFGGGTWLTDEITLRASLLSGISPSSQGSGIGFRVASIPEPSSVSLIAGGSLMLFLKRLRRGR